jgi:AcrR family transcriptional regulator
MEELKTSSQRPPSISPSAPAASSTRERIVAAAMNLFNQNGVASVPMHKIAAELGMSPGNLAYHFKNKRDMVSAIFPLLENQMRGVLKPPGIRVSPQAAAEYQIEIFRTLWRFRFFFNGLVGLLGADPSLAKCYMRFQDWVVGTLDGLLVGLVSHGDMRTIAAPNTTHLVATNMWMLWLSWLRFAQLVSPDIAMVENAAIYDGALRHFSLMQPYYGREFASRLLVELQRALGQKDRGGAAARDPQSVRARL